MPKVSASDPGKTWKNGFFSIGSHASAPTYPCGTRSVPLSLNRTRQTPSRPGRTTHRCPHAKHCTAPSGLRSISASAAGTLYLCSVCLRDCRRCLSCKTSRGIAWIFYARQDSGGRRNSDIVNAGREVCPDQLRVACPGSGRSKQAGIAQLDRDPHLRPRFVGDSKTPVYPATRCVGDVTFQQKMIQRSRG